MEDSLKTETQKKLSIGIVILAIILTIIFILILLFHQEEWFNGTLFLILYIFISIPMVWLAWYRDSLDTKDFTITQEDKKLLKKAKISAIATAIITLAFMLTNGEKILILPLTISSLIMAYFICLDDWSRMKKHEIASAKLLELYKNNASTLEIITFANTHHLPISIVEETLTRH